MSDIESSLKLEDKCVLLDGLASAQRITEEDIPEKQKTPPNL